MAHALSSSSKSDVELTVKDAPADESASKAPKHTPKGARFWLVFVAICVSLFLSALEYVRTSAHAKPSTECILDRRCDDAAHHCP